MKSVLISIKPKWCELIASGKKTIEVRKTRPKCDTPFKCYIYCTLSELLTRSHYNGEIYVATSKKHQKALERNGNTTLSGKVIGEFVCKNMTCIQADIDFQGEKHLYNTAFIENRMCLNDEELFNYIYEGKRNEGYGWHISDLVVYDKPKSIKEFYHYGVRRGAKVTRPPQSWCYCEELKE